MGKQRQIAFYGGSFTGIDPLLQKDYLDVALAFVRRGLADSIRVSVRPDELSHDTLLFLAEKGVKTVEVGVQSLADRVLEASRRGHSAQQAVASIRAIKQAGLEAGAQIMVGLPEDTGAASLKTAALLCELKPHFVRVYPLVVFRDTELARWMDGGRYRPWGLGRAVGVCTRILERFERASIPVARIGLQNGEAMEGIDGAVLAGPYHPAFGHMVRARLFFSKLILCLPQPLLPSKTICFRIHPNDRPFLSGYRGDNLERLRSRLGNRTIRIVEDQGLPRGHVECLLP